MAVGKWKAAKVITTITGGSGNGHEITMYRCGKTLENIVNAILDFGGWTWNDTIHRLDDSAVQSGYGMTYTTMEYKNGTKLWVAYTARGVPLHYKCFSQVRMGKLPNTTTGSMFPALTDLNNNNFFVDNDGGGWQAGLLMSLLPAGLNEDYGTPTLERTFDWFPAHATPICGHLGQYSEAFSTIHFRTAAQSGSSPEHMYILSQDDCFMVLVNSSVWAGSTSGVQCTFAPRTQGYITGRIFEATNPDDNQPYSQFGWIGGNFSAYANYVLGRTDIWAWDARLGVNSGMCRSMLPYTILQVDGRGLFSSDQTYPRGGMGWFTADGRRFNQSTGNTTYYLKGMGTDKGSYLSSNYAWSDMLETDPAKLHFYPLIAGTMVYDEKWGGDARTPTKNTAIKGIIRRDLALACEYKSDTENLFAQIPAHGAKLAGGNYIMGPSYMCFGWNPDYTDEQTEDLCAFRQHSGFYRDSSTDEIFGNNVIITGVCSDSSNVYMVAVDSSDHPRFAKIALGVTTGATTYTANDITIAHYDDWGCQPKIMVSNADGTIYAFLKTASDTITRYSINTSTMVPTAVSTHTHTNTNFFEISQNRAGIWSILLADAYASSGYYDIYSYNGNTQLFSYIGDTSVYDVHHAVLNNHFNDIVVVDDTNGVTYLPISNSRTGWQQTINDKIERNLFLHYIFADNADRIYIFGRSSTKGIYCCKFNYDGTFIKTRYYNYGFLNNIIFNKYENRFHIVGRTFDDTTRWFATLSLDGIWDLCSEETGDTSLICLTAENANDYVIASNTISPMRSTYYIYKRSWVS